MFVLLFVWITTVAPGVGAAGGSVLTKRSTDDDWYMSNVEYGWQGTSCVYDQYGYCLRNCTSYVSQRLASAGVPESDFKGLGNGGDWYLSAKNKGVAVGTTPKLGSVAVSTEINHVAVVDKINNDGTIDVKSYNGYKEEPWFEYGSSRYSKFIYFANSSQQVLPAQSSAKENYRGAKLSKGETLRQGDYLLSGNVRFKLFFENDGNLSIHYKNKRIWSAGTAGKGGNRLVMQGDGNLVMYKSGGRAVWNSGTQRTSSDRFVMQTDGNFVGYAGNRSTWASHTSGHKSFSYFGSGALKTGETLVKGKYLRSSDRRYALLMQFNGDLVLYGAGHKVLWNTGTAGKGSDRLVMQGDGNLVLYSGGSPKWASYTVGRGERAVLQSDGNFVIYSGGAASWASHTAE